MKKGKLELGTLEEEVFSRLGHKRKETVLGPGPGEDCAALDLGGDLVVLSTDPITGADEEGGYLAVMVSCNDILSNGAQPVAVMLTIMLRPDEDEETVARIMASADRAAKEMEVDIIGGHTEFTPGLSQNILSVTAIGRVKKDRLLRTDKVQPGDELILTKSAGLEGTSILCADYPGPLKEILGEDLYEQGLEMAKLISVAPEARLARDMDVHAMHDVTEGGVLGACYEMASASGLGLSVWEDKIPLAPVTRALSQALNINPYRLISSGCLLIASPSGQDLLAALKKAGISAASIGRFTGRDMILETGQAKESLKPPKGDELWLAKARLSSHKP